MEGSKKWLDQFPAEQRGLIERWFVDTVQSLPGETSLNRLCSALARRLTMDRQDRGPGRVVDQESVIQAMRNDPDGARAFMQHMLNQEARSPEEKAADQEKEEGLGKQRYMEGLPPTQKQLDILLKLGVDVLPADRWEASRLIDANKDW